MATQKHTAQAKNHPEPEWSLLPAELIQLISEKVIFMEQYANMRLVCKKWRLASPPNPLHLTNQVPFLQLPLPQNPDDSTFSFYDFSKSEIHNFDPLVFIDTDTPSSRGWFLLEERLDLSLYNPIIGELKRNCLPSLASHPTILDFARSKKIINPIHFDLDTVLNGLDNVYEPYIRDVILTSSPSNEDCIVVALFRDSEWHLGFCQIGDDSWTLLKLKDSKHEIRSLKYINGLVYTMQDRGQITVYDLRALSRKVLIGNLSHARVHGDLYLVIGNQGYLDGVPLLVRHPNGWSEHGKGFHVYKLVNETARPKWKRVKDIGNSVLLLSEKECEMVPVDAIKVNGWERNHICLCRRESRLKDVVNAKMIDVKDGFVREVLKDFGKFDWECGFTSLFTPSWC